MRNETADRRKKTLPVYLGLNCAAHKMLIAEPFGPVHSKQDGISSVIELLRP